MIRSAFFKELEYLLQDLDELDREDALAYYRDYMDEAGIGENDSVDSFVDCPEKIAMSIRASLEDSENLHIETDEEGFKNSCIESISNAPEVYNQNDEQTKEDTTAEKHDRREERNFEQMHSSHNTKKQKPTLGKVLLILALIILASPMILAIGGALFGVIVTVIAILIALIVGVVGVSAACVVGGIGLIIASIAVLMTSLTKGIFTLGVALLMIAAGILFTLLTLFIFKRVLPGLIRGIVGILRKIFNRNGGRSL